MSLQVDVITSYTLSLGVLGTRRISSLRPASGREFKQNARDVPRFIPGFIREFPSQIPDSETVAKIVMKKGCSGSRSPHSESQSHAFRRGSCVDGKWEAYSQVIHRAHLLRGRKRLDIRNQGAFPQAKMAFSSQRKVLKNAQKVLTLEARVFCACIRACSTGFPSKGYVGKPRPRSQNKIPPR
jgi:hypothetical protein